MKQLLYLLIGASLTFSTGQMYAQSSEPVIAYATYQFSHVSDTNQRENKYQEEFMLALSQNASVFSSYSLMEARGQFKRNPFSQNSFGTAPAIQANVSRYFYPKEYTLLHTDRRLYIVENLVNNYLYEMEFPAIAWKIDTITRVIQGLNSQKATANHKGRNWTVWFCSDIPFSAGPWELCGLPGLIVHAFDSTGDIKFELMSFEQANTMDTSGFPTNKLHISVPKSSAESPLIDADKAAIERLWRAYEINPSQFVMAQIRAAGGVIHHLVQMESLAQRPIINNPIA